MRELSRFFGKISALCWGVTSGFEGLEGFAASIEDDLTGLRFGAAAPNEGFCAEIAAVEGDLGFAGPSVVLQCILGSALRFCVVLRWLRAPNRGRSLRAVSLAFKIYHLRLGARERRSFNIYLPTVVVRIGSFHNSIFCLCL